MPLKKKKTRRKKLQKKTVKRKVIRKKRLPARKTAKKTTAKKPTAEKKVAKKLGEGVLGVVTHYFPKVRAGVVKLKAPLVLGDTVKIKGHTTDFTQNVTSMQINHVTIDKAKKGQEIGLLVDSRVRKHDIVYKG